MIKRIFFVDRNVISRIKDSTLTEDNRLLLESIDIKGHRVTSLLATVEGQSGVMQTLDELKTSIAKDYVTLKGFFKHAATQDMEMALASESHLHGLLELTQERWEKYAAFIGFAQSMLYQDVGSAKRKATRDAILKKADELAVPRSSFEVLCAISSLYRLDYAYRTLKPSPKITETEKRIHNALQDLSLVRLFLTLKMLLQAEGVSETYFITFDEWLAGFVRIAQIEPMGFVQTETLSSHFRVSPTKELFPGISDADFEELYPLLGATRQLIGWAVPSPQIKMRYRLSLVLESDTNKQINQHSE